MWWTPEMHGNSIFPSTMTCANGVFFLARGLPPYTTNFTFSGLLFCCKSKLTRRLTIPLGVLMALVTTSEDIRSVKVSPLDSRLDVLVYIFLGAPGLRGSRTPVHLRSSRTPKLPTWRLRLPTIKPRHLLNLLGNGGNRKDHGKG